MESGRVGRGCYEDSRENVARVGEDVTSVLRGILLLLLLSTFIERTFAGCHKCAEDNSYTLNNNVFSLFLNVVRVMSGDLSSSGRLKNLRFTGGNEADYLRYYGGDRHTKTDFRFALTSNSYSYVLSVVILCELNIR